MKIATGIGDYFGTKQKIKRFGRSKRKFLKFGIFQQFNCISELMLVNEEKQKKIYDIILQKNEITFCNDKDEMQFLAATLSNIENKIDCPESLYDAEFWYMDVDDLYQLEQQYLIGNVNEVLQFFIAKKIVILVIDNIHSYINNPDKEFKDHIHNNFYCISEYIDNLKLLSNVKIINISKNPNFLPLIDD